MCEQSHLKSPFGFDTPEDSPGFLLWQTTISWQRLLKKVLAPHTLTHPQFVLMALLLWLEGQTREATQVTLARLSKLDKMTISTSLKQLEKRGLVTRQESTSDPRAKRVSLKPQGKALVSSLVPLIEKSDEDFFNSLTPEEQSLFKKMLRRVIL